MNAKKRILKSLAALALICGLSVSAQACVTATMGGGWQNSPMSSETGTFTATFDATPSASPTNSVVALSNGAQTAYGSFACLARFNPSGDIDARNGGAYAAASTIPYSAGVSYHFSLVVNVAAQTYSIYVTPAGGSQITVGLNYAFRISDTTLNYWGVFVDSGSGGAGSVSVCNFSATGGGSNSFTITASAGSGGSISPSGAVSVAQGANQSFSITANSGFTVSSVSVDGASVGAVTSYNFSNVQANHTISASFAAVTTNFTITASAGANGSISPSGSVSVAQGASQTFTITPNIGYTVSSLTVDSVNVGTMQSYTFSNVQANHTISASFAAVTTNFTITASAGANGSISPSGSVSVAQGASQSFTIAPASGYKVSSVTVDGTSVGAVTSYTFSNVQANHTISAAFQSSSSGCVTATAGGSWQNSAMTSQTSTFTATFDATPSASPTNSVIALSNGAQTAYGSFACLARFNPTGDIDAYNGSVSGYAAGATIPYSAGVSYHFRLVVNVSAQTYSVYVTPAGGSELTVGTNYGFRISATSLNYWGVYVSSSSGGTGTDTQCAKLLHGAAAVETPTRSRPAPAAADRSARRAPLRWSRVPANRSRLRPIPDSP